MFRIASRATLAAALASALLAGTASVASAASVPAPVTSASRCSENTTFTIYTYYSDGSYTTVVGWGELDCDGNFNMHSGYQTPWFRTKTGPCPT